MTVSGTIVRPVPGDTVPASRVLVVLHRVGQDRQGPVDSILTGPDGRFSLRALPDSAVLFLISARYGGIEFFGEPIRLGGGAPLSPIRLLVADTSSTAPVGLGGRYIVVGAPDSSLQRTVIDLFVLSNQGLTTRVAADSSAPTWTMVLPAAARHRVPEVGSDISALSVRFQGDTVLVFAPLPPGTKQLLIEHRWPSDEARFAFPLGPEETDLQVVTEEPGATVSASGVHKVEAQVLDGRPLERWAGRAAATGTLVISLPSHQGQEPRAILLLVAGFAILLVVAGALLARRSGLARVGGRP